MAQEAHDTSCPMAGCGGPTYWRRDGYRVCMHCGHELAKHESANGADASAGRSATRAVSSSGLIAAGLVAGAMVFSLARTAHPDLALPIAAREAAVDDGDWVARLRRGEVGLEELRSRLRYRSLADLEATNPTLPSERTASIAQDWVNFHAETKRQIALVLNDLADTTQGAATYRSVQLPVTLLLGEILLAGVELEPRALERLIENFRVYAKEYGDPLLQAVGRIVQGYAPPEPRLQRALHDFLLDPS